MFGKKSSRKDEFANLTAIRDLKDSEIKESEGDLEKELIELLKDNEDIDGIQPDSDTASDDEELLAELEAFCSDDKTPPKSTNHSLSPSPSKQPNKRVTPSPNLNQLSVQQIHERRTDYESAIAALLDSSSPDCSKIESFTQVVDQLNDLEVRLKKGESIGIDKLPPVPDYAHSPTRSAQPAPSAPTAQQEPSQTQRSEPKQDGRQLVLDYVNPQGSQDSGMIALKKRLQEYKLAAVQARDAGQIERAKQLLMASKCIGEAIQKIEAGEESFDPSTDMPPPPSEFEAPPDDDADEEPQPGNSQQQQQQQQSQQQQLAKDMAVITTPIVNVDNLTKRMAYFQNMVVELQKDSSQDAKRRRMGRIVKQYEEALVACKRGISTYSYSALPTPPGCPELTDLSQLAPSSNQRPTAGAVASGSATGRTAAPAAVAVTSSSKPANTTSPDIATLLTRRQTELKIAAARAKQAGNIEQAKRYLISARGMAPMIQAAAAGMPINKSQIPPPPSTTSPDSSSSFVIFTGQTCDTPVEYVELMANRASEKVLFKILEAQEKEACELLAKHQKSGERKYVDGLSELAKSVSLDKKTIINGIKSRFYFELVNLPRLNMNVDLADDILEVMSIRGIDYPMPSGISSADHLDTYAELQLSYPSSSEPTKLTSEWVKHSNQPSYMLQNGKIPVKIKTRLYRQIVQSNRGLKATIYYKRGLLKSYGVLGTVNIPLSGLLNSATITHIGNLMTGYRASGGQLEIKLRQRQSLLGESITYVQKPWLRLQLLKPNPQPAVSAASSNTPTSKQQVIQITRDYSSDRSGSSSHSRHHDSHPQSHPHQRSDRLPQYKSTQR